MTYVMWRHVKSHSSAERSLRYEVLVSETPMVVYNGTTSSPPGICVLIIVHESLYFNETLAYHE